MRPDAGSVAFPYCRPYPTQVLPHDDVTQIVVADGGFIVVVARNNTVVVLPAEKKVFFHCHPI